MFDNDTSFYRELILDHAQNQRNWGLLTPNDFDHAESNPLCGDVLHLTLQLDAHGVIQSVGWAGHGCAISQASASLLGETLVGKTFAQVAALRREDMLGLLGIPLTPNRMKCALLPLKTVLVGLVDQRHWEQVEDGE